MVLDARIWTFSDTILYTVGAIGTCSFQQSCAAIARTMDLSTAVLFVAIVT